MFIERYTHRHRSDFYAVLKCEHCGGNQDLKSGYDDAYYHDSVLPAIKCKACGQSRTPQESESE
jgi:ribosomal protein S27E